MKKRYCDFCKKEITGDYHKLTLVEHKDKKIMMNHSGDMCLDCKKEADKDVSR